MMIKPKLYDSRQIQVVVEREAAFDHGFKKCSVLIMQMALIFMQVSRLYSGGLPHLTPIAGHVLTLVHVIIFIGFLFDSTTIMGCYVFSLALYAAIPLAIVELFFTDVLYKVVFGCNVHITNNENVSDSLYVMFIYGIYLAGLLVYTWVCYDLIRYIKKKENAGILPFTNKDACHIKPHDNMKKEQIKSSK